MASKVLPLKFVKKDWKTSTDIRWWRADLAAFGHYTICGESDRSFKYAFNRGSDLARWPSKPSYDEAVAECQKDWEHRARQIRDSINKFFFSES